MKRTTLTVTFLVLLIVGTLSVELGRANFMPFKLEPNTDAPVFMIQDQKLDTIVDSNLLNFSLTKPDSWTIYNNIDGELIGGKIIDLSYRLGWDGLVHFIQFENRNITTTNLVYEIDNLEKTSYHSINLTGLEDGDHILFVNVTVATFYNPFEDYWNIHEYGMFVSAEIFLTTSSSSGVMSFSVHEIIMNVVSDDEVYFDLVSPVVSVFSVDNQTGELFVPLEFSLSEPVSWIGYSLDGQSNVTISGNTTLTELAYGLHSIVVYATDYSGNLGYSETINFSVDAFPITLVIGSFAVIAVVGLGIFVYFKKRRS